MAKEFYKETGDVAVVTLKEATNDRNYINKDERLVREPSV